jgi:hypothetical protein
MVTYAGVRAQGINVIVSECEGSDIERELLWRWLSSGLPRRVVAIIRLIIAMKMEAAFSSETFADTDKSARSQNRKISSDYFCIRTKQGNIYIYTWQKLIKYFDFKTN